MPAERRDLSSRTAQEAARDREIDDESITLETVQKLQTALHAKAKGDLQFRFYSLYDKVYRLDVLWSAWRRCRSNDGSPGIDGRTFEDIENYGVMKWLKELAEERRFCTLDSAVIVGRLNRQLRGWANYFRLGPVSKAYRAVDSHAANRLRQWLCVKYKQPGRGTARFPDAYLYEYLGLIRLSNLPRSFPWAKA